MPKLHSFLLDFTSKIEKYIFLDYWDDYLSESKRHGLIANNRMRTANHSTVSTSDFQVSTKASNQIFSVPFLPSEITMR